MTLGLLESISQQQPLRLLLLILELSDNGVLARLVLASTKLLQVDLIGSVGDAQRPDHGPQIGQGRILADTGGAVGLDSAVDDGQGGLGDEDLGLGDLLESGLGVALVDLDGGVKDDEAGGVDLDAGSGDPLEDDAVGGQRLAEGLLAVVVDTGDEPLEGLFGGADGAHRVVDASGPQPALDNLEAAALS